MIRSPGAGFGFESRLPRVASSRLTQAVAASLAVGAVSMWLIVALTILTIRVSMAMPPPA